VALAGFIIGAFSGGVVRAVAVDVHVGVLTPTASGVDVNGTGDVTAVLEGFAAALSVRESLRQYFGAFRALMEWVMLAREVFI
jgi:hypothetical protein